jgi:hypothetical protein
MSIMVPVSWFTRTFRDKLRNKVSSTKESQAAEPSQGTHEFLAQESLALTKMNWNSTQFDGSDPITQRAAHQVGNILKYVGEDEAISSRYSFYM